MKTCAQKKQFEDIFVLTIDKEPVRFNMAFTEFTIVSSQCVITVTDIEKKLLCQSFCFLYYSNNFDIK